MGCAKGRRWKWLLLLGSIFLLSTGCTLTSLVARPPATPEPTPTNTPRPTFTPTPADEEILILVTPTPPSLDPAFGRLHSVSVHTEEEAPDVAGIAETDDAFVPPMPTATPTPTPTPVPPTPTPEPVVAIVQANQVNVRTGPSTQHDIVDQVNQGAVLTIVGKNPEGDWWQVCCVNAQEVWIFGQLVQTEGPINTVSIAGDIPPPPPPTPVPPPTAVPPPPEPTATPTITPTPAPPFELGAELTPMQVDSSGITLWVRVEEGRGTPNERPLPGYRLHVEMDRQPVQPVDGILVSLDRFEYSAPPDFGNRVEYNLSFYWEPPAGQELPHAPWQVWLVDGAGNKVSSPVSFITSPMNPNRELYFGFNRRAP